MASIIRFRPIFIGDDGLQPEPRGGMITFWEYVISNLQYPDSARQQKVEGKVFVKFLVETDGSLTELEAIKGIGYGCDEEAIRLVKQSSPWYPGTQGGKLVEVRMVLPISFRLDNQ